MSDRASSIQAFLDARGWGTAMRGPLAGDASFRRYERLRVGYNAAVLMDAPPPEEDVTAFLRIARHLSALGYSAPDILADDTAAGLLLLEDLGDDTYTKVLAQRPEREFDLYALAVDVLIDLHGRAAKDALPPGLPSYDRDRLMAEALLLTDWYLPAATGEQVPTNLRKSFIAAWDACLQPALDAPQTLVLRDYHVDNLMWLPQRSGLARCGLLDFQDAVAGPAVYDLMSLLEDARRDIDRGFRDAMLARYKDAFTALSDGGAARDDFAAVYAILGAQRHAKVIGIFTRLSVRDAKPAYQVHIPRVWGLLETSLSHPALEPVRQWFDEHVTQEMRTRPTMPRQAE